MGSLKCITPRTATFHSVRMAPEYMDYWNTVICLPLPEFLARKILQILHGYHKSQAETNEDMLLE